MTLNFDNNNRTPQLTCVGHIIILNVIMWLIASLLECRFKFSLNLLLGMSFWKSSYFHFFQPLTYMFMHDLSGISHIFFNMFALFMFGRVFEQIWGGKKFLIFYLVSGIVAALVQQIIWTCILPDYAMAMTVGASGAIFGLLLAFGWMFPEQSIYIMFLPIPIKARWFVGIYAVIELLAGVSGFKFDNVAHFAHLGGMLGALLLLLFWKKRGVLYSRRLK